MSKTTITKSDLGPEICNIDEVCIHWGKSKNTIYRWIRTGRFPTPFYQSGKCYWLIDDLTSHENELVLRNKVKTVHKSTGFKS